MNQFFDDLAKMLATPMPRRKVFRFVGGALAAAVVGGFGMQTASAAPCPAPNKLCGNTTVTSVCCAPGTCCAKLGAVAHCCNPGQCVCATGTCQASSGGSCPSGCTIC